MPCFPALESLTPRDGNSQQSGSHPQKGHLPLPLTCPWPSGKTVFSGILDSHSFPHQLLKCSDADHSLETHLRGEQSMVRFMQPLQISTARPHSHRPHGTWQSMGSKASSDRKPSPVPRSVPQSENPVRPHLSWDPGLHAVQGLSACS